jgi:ribose 5-phosphate isomerase A
MASIDDLKRQAAREAVKRVKSGMRVGLGTGSTAKHAVIAIGEMLKSGELEDIVGMPTSEATAELAKAYNIPLAKLDHLDLAIDGADEVDPQANLIKGGGGAMLRERAVEILADTFIVIADESKLSPRLGLKFALPIEMPADAVSAEADFIKSLGGEPKRRGGDTPFVTDNGHAILDVRFANGIDDTYALAAALDKRPAIKAHGLFLDMTTTLIIAAYSGIQVREIK